MAAAPTASLSAGASGGLAFSRVFSRSGAQFERAAYHGEEAREAAPAIHSGGVVALVFVFVGVIGSLGIGVKLDATSFLGGTLIGFSDALRAGLVEWTKRVVILPSNANGDSDLGARAKEEEERKRRAEEATAKTTLRP
jgi:hypothetical protein